MSYKHYYGERMSIFVTTIEAAGEMSYRHAEDQMFVFGCAFIERKDPRRKLLNRHFRLNLVSKGSSRLSAKMKTSVSLMVLQKIKENAWEQPVYDALEKEKTEVFAALDALLDIYEMLIVVYERVALNESNKDILKAFMESIGPSAHAEFSPEPATPTSAVGYGTRRSECNQLTPQAVPQIGDSSGSAKYDESAIVLMPSPTTDPASTLTIPSVSSFLDSEPAKRCKEASSPTTETQLENFTLAGNKRGLPEDATAGPSTKKMRIGSQSLQVTICTDHYNDGTSSQKIILNTQSTD